MALSREQLAEGLKAQANDEEAAVREFIPYLESTDGKAFVEKMRSFHARTVPGSTFDQVFNSVLSVIGSTAELARQNVVALDAAKAQEAGVVDDNLPPPVTVTKGEQAPAVADPVTETE